MHAHFMHLWKSSIAVVIWPAYFILLITCPSLFLNADYLDLKTQMEKDPTDG